MSVDNHNYKIFDYVLTSTIPLPELIGTPSQNISKQNPKKIIFKLEQVKPSTSTHPVWFHHWYLSDGRISISCGKDGSVYHLLFPNIAEFHIIPDCYQINCFPLTNKIGIIRHLLLDQVIPRVLYHNGEFVVHASGINFATGGGLFLGETGYGKSTIAMKLCHLGFPLISDDCVLLRKEAGKVLIVPNYPGARLWPVSVSVLFPQRKLTKLSNKIRFNISDKDRKMGDIPSSYLTVLFFLNNPSEKADFSITTISGAAKAIELIKHCFPLDIFDQQLQKTQFINLSTIVDSPGITCRTLSYRREYGELQSVCEQIVSYCQPYR